jgi:hypothetical protein
VRVSFSCLIVSRTDQPQFSGNTEAGDAQLERVDLAVKRGLRDKLHWLSEPNLDGDRRAQSQRFTTLLKERAAQVKREAQALWDRQVALLAQGQTV